MARQLNVPHRLDILIEKMVSPNYTWEIDLDHYQDRKIISVTKGNDEGVYLTFFPRGQVELGTYQKATPRTKFKVVSRSALFDTQIEAMQYVVDQFGIQILQNYYKRE